MPIITSLQYSERTLLRHETVITMASLLMPVPSEYLVHCQAHNVSSNTATARSEGTTGSVKAGMPQCTAPFDDSISRDIVFHALGIVTLMQVCGVRWLSDKFVASGGSQVRIQL